MEHALQTIASSGSTPMKAQPLPTVGSDVKSVANTLANEVIAQAMSVSTTWKGYALRIIALPADGRTQFLKSIDDWLKGIRKTTAETMGNTNREGKPDPTKDDGQRAAKRVNSATVEVSKLRKIAQAWNSGGSTEGLVDYVRRVQRNPNFGEQDLPNLGYEVVVEYARTFSESTAGRKADPWIIKLSKWMEKNPVPADDPKAALLAKLIADEVAKSAQ